MRTVDVTRCCLYARYVVSVTLIACVQIHLGREDEGEMDYLCDTCGNCICTCASRSSEADDDGDDEDDEDDDVDVNNVGEDNNNGGDISPTNDMSGNIIATMDDVFEVPDTQAGEVMELSTIACDSRNNVLDMMNDGEEISQSMENPFPPQDNDTYMSTTENWAVVLAKKKRKCKTAAVSSPCTHKRGKIETNKHKC